MDRRKFLHNTLIGFGSLPLARRSVAGQNFESNPFTLGVASGDVTSTGVVLWTRLAPEPEKADGGMPRMPVAVDWELYLDRAMTRLVRRGQALAMPELAHSVHLELDGLQPRSHYWYRFRVGGHVSPAGRTLTLPDSLDPLDSAHSGDSSAAVRFATASCQNYTHGHFVAYRQMVRDDPDFVIHLGDYIYDTAFGESFRQHPGSEAPQTLDDFRRWHACYKSDRFLREAHAALPFFLAIDNHDALDHNDPSRAAQRAAAFQAWYEHMPVRGYPGAGANAFSLHRCIRVGEIAQICLLDGRQFRDPWDICGEDYDPGYGFGNYRQRCEAIFAEDRSMLGATQEQWLNERLQDNRTAWNVIASPGPFLPFSYREGGRDLRYVSAWDAYPANRQRVARALAQSTTGHPMILSGDVHSFWAVDGSAVREPQERIPVVEFVTSSISANWPPVLAQPVSDNLSHNPQVRFYDPAHRGYLLHQVSASEWQTTARGVDDVQDDESPVRSVARFRVRHGEAGLTRMADPG
jgi:alkaline phosphatase D